MTKQRLNTVTVKVKPEAGLTKLAADGVSVKDAADKKVDVTG